MEKNQNEFDSDATPNNANNNLQSFSNSLAVLNSSKKKVNDTGN